MIRDPEVQLLAALSEGLKSEYQIEEDLSWLQSPFGWIKSQTSRRKGAIGEKLVAGWCAARDINVLRSPDAEADRVLEGFRTEIKFSTLWANPDLQVPANPRSGLSALGLSGSFSVHCSRVGFRKGVRDLEYRPGHRVVPSTRWHGGPRYGLAQRFADRRTFLDECVRRGPRYRNAPTTDSGRFAIGVSPVNRGLSQCVWKKGIVAHKGLESRCPAGCVAPDLELSGMHVGALNQFLR